MWTKSKSNSIKVLISKALTDSVISHNEFTIKNDVQNEYNQMKVEINNQKRLNHVYQRF